MSALCVIVATGASPKHLEVPGAKEYIGKGVSHCASCDGPLLRGAVVAVVGAGDSAMQEALTLAAHVSKVVLLCRGTALAGQAIYRDRVLAEPKIEVRYSAEVEEIMGDDRRDRRATARRARDAGRSRGLHLYWPRPEHRFP